MQVTFSSCTQWARWKGRKHLLFMPMMSNGADLFYYRGLNNSTSAAWLSPHHASLNIFPRCPISPPSLSLHLHPGLMPSVCLTAACTPLSGSPAPLIHANFLVGKYRCLTASFLTICKPNVTNMVSKVFPRVQTAWNKDCKCSSYIW